MFKSRFFKIYYLIVVFVFVINSVYLVKSNLFFDIENLPQGNYLYSKSSPDSLFKLDVYRVENSIGSAVRISATNTSSGETRNIYWQVNTENIELEWRGNNEIVVDEMPINVAHGGFYDCRRGLSIFLSGSLY